MQVTFDHVILHTDKIYKLQGSAACAMQSKHLALAVPDNTHFSQYSCEAGAEQIDPEDQPQDPELCQLPGPSKNRI